MLLVTGLTGHSGRYFLEELIKNKYKGRIRCIIRETSDTTLLDNSGLNIEKVIGDISDETFLDNCMKDVKQVLHIVNIRYTLPLIKAAIKNEVPRVICVHTTGIYSKFRVASEEYLVIEKEIRRTLSEEQLKITILRPTMIFGDMCDLNISKFIKMVDKLRLFPVINHGRGLIQPVNARDLGKAYYKVLMLQPDLAKQEYNLSGDRPIEMIEVFKLISNKLGKKTLFISLPLSLGVFLARCLKVLTLGNIDYIERVQRMSEDRCFSHKSAQKDFGYKPEAFEVGLDREVREYLKDSR